MPHLPLVEFITRRGCCLCDEALAVVRAAAERALFELRVVDVDSGPELQEDHGAYVPVVLVDGRRFAAYHVDGDALVTRLGEAAAGAARKQGAA